jgi:16S rRNA processing protein RimM
VPDDIIVGRILGAFGLRGEVKIAAADPSALRAGLRIGLRDTSGVESGAIVETVRPHKNYLVVRLRALDDPDAARGLSGATVTMAQRDLPELPPHAYRRGKLVGLQVVDGRRGALGPVVEIRRYPSCDMLVVGAAQLLVPMLHAYRVEVDVAAGEIRVDLPPGFEELA